MPRTAAISAFSKPPKYRNSTIWAWRASSCARSLSARSKSIRSTGSDRPAGRSEEHTSELPSPCNLVCRLLIEIKRSEPTSPAPGGAAPPARAANRSAVFPGKPPGRFFFFFFNDPATTEIHPLSLHDALPIYPPRRSDCRPSWRSKPIARPIRPAPPDLVNPPTLVLQLRQPDPEDLAAHRDRRGRPGPGGRLIPSPPPSRRTDRT